MNSSSALVSKATSTHESRRLERRAGSGEAAHPSMKPEPSIKPESSVKIEDIMKVEENEEPPVESDAQVRLKDTRFVAHVDYFLFLFF